MSEYTIDGEGAISAITTNTEFHCFDKDSSLRTKKATAAQIATYVATSPSAAGSSNPMVDAESYCILGSDYTLTDSNSAQKALNTSTNGAITLAGSTTYEFELMFNITNSGTTSHTWALVFGGTATFSTGTNFTASGNSSGTANAAGTGGLSGFCTSPGTAMVLTPASTSATEQATLFAAGTLVVNAGGTLIPQVKLSAATGGTETMKAGSFFRVWQTAGTGTVGNWS